MLSMKMMMMMMKTEMKTEMIGIILIMSLTLTKQALMNILNQSVT